MLRLYLCTYITTFALIIKRLTKTFEKDRAVRTQLALLQITKILQNPVARLCYCVLDSPSQVIGAIFAKRV